MLVALSDTATRTALRTHLERAGLDCAIAPDPSTFLTLVTGTYFDAVVVDTASTGVTLADLSRAVRRTPLNLQAVFVTTEPGAMGDAAGLDLRAARRQGASELATTVLSVVHERPSRPGDDWLPPIVLHDLHIDPARLRLRVRGRIVPVTRLECQVLHLLASHPGVVFSRERLLARLWPTNTFVTPRSVDALVGRLRRKIEADRHRPQILLTAWGEGYRIAEP